MGTTRFSHAHFFDETVFGLGNTVFGRELSASEAEERENIASRVTVTFEGAIFEKPERVRFYQVNKGGRLPGQQPHVEPPIYTPLRAYFTNCNVGLVHFEDVNWDTREGRLVLEDEERLRRALSRETTPTPETA